MSVLDSIDNYYENMVMEEMARQLGEQSVDEDFLIDVTCVALNRLPPRYMSHQVDIAYYMAPSEFEEMRAKVEVAVREAINYVKKSDH